MNGFKGKDCEIGMSLTTSIYDSFRCWFGVGDIYEVAVCQAGLAKPGMMGQFSLVIPTWMGALRT